MAGPSLHRIRARVAEDLTRWGHRRRSRERRKLSAEYERLAFLILRLEESPYVTVVRDEDWDYLRDAVAYWPDQDLFDQLVAKRYLDACEHQATVVEAGSEMLERLFPDLEDAEESSEEDDDSDDD